MKKIEAYKTQDWLLFEDKLKAQEYQMASEERQLKINKQWKVIIAYYQHYKYYENEITTRTIQEAADNLISDAAYWFSANQTLIVENEKTIYSVWSPLLSELKSRYWDYEIKDIEEEFSSDD
jgi:hypothetical protein